MKLSRFWRIPFFHWLFSAEWCDTAVGLWSLLAVACVIVYGGCSSFGNYPVRGKVVDPSGQPIPGLEGSQIGFTMVNGPTTSVGEIAADGSFTLFTEKPGDGVPPGEYQVNIPRRYLDPEHPAPQAIDAKYEKLETSGLNVTVEPKTNTFEFKVNPAGKK